ncbi:MAG: hypothetical protein WD055_02780 [Candidatus Dependentiae bacterium]
MKLFQKLLILTAIGLFKVQAVTIVYNLRIAETTRLQKIEQGLTRGNLAGSAMVNQYRRLYNDLFQRTTAGIGNYVRTFGRSYVRVLELSAMWLIL